jgi:minor extracellular protease Epr
MKPRILRSLALCSNLLVLSQHSSAQALPGGLGNAVEGAVQGAVERQVEQAQNAAVERATEQAAAAAASVAQERAAAVQAEVVQSQTLEQVQAQVERLQTQVEAAQGEIGQIQDQIATVAVDQAATAAARAFVDIELAVNLRAVEFEWIMLVTPEQRARLNVEAAELLKYLTTSESITLAGDQELLRFRVPPELDANDAVLELVPENLRSLIDRNHIYDARDLLGR